MAQGMNKRAWPNHDWWIVCSRVFWMRKNILSDRQREVFDRRLRGQTFAEIGGALFNHWTKERGICAQNARNLFEKAYRRLFWTDLGRKFAKKFEEEGGSKVKILHEEEEWLNKW